MDIFQKCYDFKEARIARKAGYYPYFLPVASEHGAEVIIDGKKMIMFSRNDYLGLVAHPEVKDAAKSAVEKYGTSSTASRFVSGTLDIHCKLEEKLAEFLNKESAVVFATGMQANLGAISAIAGPNDLLITDKFDHASILDGCRLSSAKMKRVQHNDMESLEFVLKSLDKDKAKLIIVDGIYSMEGDIAKLPEICALVKEYDADVMLDDAHGIGVLGGEKGRGTAAHFGLTNEIDLIMGTFSKSFAAIGGFVAGDFSVVDYIKHFARSMVFSAALPAASTAAASKSLDIIQSEPERRKLLWENTRKLLKGFKSIGFDTGKSCTPIIPLIIPSRKKAVALWQALFEKGIFTSLIIPPAVPEGRTMLRISVSALHQNNHLDTLLGESEKSGKKLGII